MTRLAGLIAAPFTPMRGDGRLHLETIGRLARHLEATGVTGAFICGTTGESLSLTVSERKKVAERWIAEAPEAFRVIVHVGHTCLEDAKELARHAADVSAAAIAAMPPCFFRPKSIADLVEWCAALASVVPQLPFYYYHIPSMSGVDLSMSAFLSAAVAQIPNLAGIKFTSRDLMDYQQCVQVDGGRFDILFGKDELLLSGLAIGAKGAVGSTYNFAAPIYRRVIEAYSSQDMERARNEQSRAVDVVAAFSRYGGLPAQKAIMKMIGIDCGPVRMPLRPIDKERADALCAELESLAFFEAIKEGIA